MRGTGGGSSVESGRRRHGSAREAKEKPPGEREDRTQGNGSDRRIPSMTEFEESSTIPTQQFDQRRAEAFAERLVDVLNSGALALMTSIGHRTGLFDAMAGLPPSTSERIALIANLNERYVREWLAAMVVGRIVEHDPEDGTYYLPQEHAAFLTRAASPDNIAVTAQLIPLMASVEDPIVESFKDGGGVPYSAFPRFHEIMAEDSGQTVVAALADHILPLVPGLTDRLEAGIDVLDVGCGSGRALNLMARMFPDSRFVGYDFSEEAIAHARAEAQEHGTSNVRFEVKDAAKLDEKERYDLITTFDAIHDQAEPAAVLKGIADALKEDGVYLMQDIAGSSHVHHNLDHPIGPLLYTISTMHCMTVSLAQGGEGLGTMWGQEKAQEMLKEAGFKKVEIKQLPHDIFNNYFIITKG
jgi:2-polyprenyl-3-methyl-5-hydroxy-6-metoxy-1,4-benzoquinol methylase